MSEPILHYSNTTLVVGAPVTFDPNAPFTSLDGATLDVRARTSRRDIVTGEITLNEAGSEMTVVFREGALTPGLAEVQVYARQGEQSQIIATFEVDVRLGFRPVE